MHVRFKSYAQSSNLIFQGNVEQKCKYHKIIYFMHNKKTKNNKEPPIGESNIISISKDFLGK